MQRRASSTSEDLLPRPGSSIRPARACTESSYLIIIDGLVPNGDDSVAHKRGLLIINQIEMVSLRQVLAEPGKPSAPRRS